MTTFRSVLPFLFSSLLVWGCDDGAGGDSDYVRALCTAGYNNDVACGETPSETIEECVAPDPTDDDTCYPTLIRTDLRDAIADCVENRDCDESDDRCFSATGVGSTPTAVASSFQDYCLARLEECDVLFDDYCFLDVFRDDAIQSVRSCLEGDCADAEACVDRVFSCL